MQTYQKQPIGTSVRPDRPEWIAAKRIGTAGEHDVADVLRQIGLVVQELQEHSADLEIGGRIEVKTDRVALRTGRVAVEVLYQGRPSGVRTTTANTWAFVLDNGEILLVAIGRLRDAIAILPDRPAGEAATIRLLPLTTLRKLAMSVRGGGR